MSRTLKLKALEWVEVRSKEEILATLDKQGQLESLPFMPEMFQFCGQRFQVVKRAHKTCDPPSGMAGRRMADAVHLTGLRCDGAAHGGCQAGCLIFWKEAWLKRVDEDGPTLRRPSESPATSVVMQCTEEDVLLGVHPPDAPVLAEEPVYVCQSTKLYSATTALPWWDLRQYVEDLTSGNVRIGQMLAALSYSVCHNIIHSGIGLGSAMRWAYDTFQKMAGGTQYPWRPGKVPKGTQTPSAKLGLQPGELVKVRSYAEILETLNDDWKNRGMYFDGEMVAFCNSTHNVLTRVDQIIDEKTGKMLRMKNDCIILKDVICGARYAKCRRFCPRAIYPYWREIWLERSR